MGCRLPGLPCKYEGMLLMLLLLELGYKPPYLPMWSVPSSLTRLYEGNPSNIERLAKDGALRVWLQRVMWLWFTKASTL